MTGQFIKRTYSYFEFISDVRQIVEVLNPILWISFTNMEASQSPSEEGENCLLKSTSGVPFQGYRSTSLKVSNCRKKLTNISVIKTVIKSVN